MDTIFISYRRSNNNDLFAFHLKKDLANKGFSAFIDTENGDRQGEIDNITKSAIDSAKDFILILSKDCFKEIKNPDFFINEIEYAVEQRKTIIPIMLNGFDPHHNLPDNEYIKTVLRMSCIDPPSAINYETVFIPRLISFLSDSKEKENYLRTVCKSYLSSRPELEREPLLDRWKNAVEIDICSYFANMLINSDYINVALENGVKIRYIIVDPQSDAATDAINFKLQRFNNMKKFIQAYDATNDLVDDIENLKVTKPSSKLLNGKFEVRKTSLYIPNAIMIVKKQDKNENTAKIDLYTFDTTDQDRRSIMISYNDFDNYTFFENQFEYIWNSDKTVPIKS